MGRGVLPGPVPLGRGGAVQARGAAAVDPMGRILQGATPKSLPEELLQLAREPYLTTVDAAAAAAGARAQGLGPAAAVAEAWAQQPHPDMKRAELLLTKVIQNCVQNPLNPHTCVRH